MYMFYFVYTEGVGEVVRPCETATALKWLNKPSECCWIVPGTVNPADD
jgi:hypothetical protein